MKAVVAAFNQEKALVGAFSVITNLRMELFEALEGRGGGVKISPRPPAEALVFVPVVKTNKRTLIVIVSWWGKYSC